MGVYHSGLLSARVAERVIGKSERVRTLRGLGKAIILRIRRFS